jgi:hypothetical protein
MTKRETPRDADGNKICAWCGGAIVQPPTGRSRDYCSRTHREYAYRKRREAEIRLVAYSRGRADERSLSTTGETQPSLVSPVVETPVQVKPGEVRQPMVGTSPFPTLWDDEG